MRLVFAAGGFFIGLADGFFFGLEFGAYREAHREFERRYEEDRGLVMPVLSADPSFRQIQTMNFPVAGLCLQGPVGSLEDRRRLNAAVLMLFGEQRVQHIMQDVVVEPVAAPGH